MHVATDRKKITNAAAAHFTAVSVLCVAVISRIRAELMLDDVDLHSVHTAACMFSGSGGGIICLEQGIVLNNAHF